MTKPALAALVAFVIAVPAGLWAVKSRLSVNPPPASPPPELPVNTISVSERPFVTLSPDPSGRNLFFTVSGAPVSGDLEYELVYNAEGKQEGVFGRLDLESEKQPIEKKLLLGSQSAGGKITYHEGVTGGFATITYDSVRLKEQWNFLPFDLLDLTYSAPDGRFSVTLGKTALKPDQVVILMKPFGLPVGLPDGAVLLAGPYALLAPTAVKGPLTVELKLPAGEYVEPQLLAYDGNSWLPLKTEIGNDQETLISTAENASVFVAVTP